MKYFYLSFLATLYIATADAQLTVANHAPVAGETHQRYQCDSTGIVPGPGGANSLWNFSMATHSSVVHSYTAGSSSFHQPATVSVTSNKSYEDHYKINPSALVDYSSSFPIVSGYYINLNYNVPSVKARYPMSLNTTSTAATSGNINAIMINPQAGTFNGTSTTLADGTGTLILPGNTYTNVIRVVNTEVISYNVSVPGTITMKNYDYYAVGAKQPVFSIVTVTLTRPAATVRRTLVTRLIHTAPAPVDMTPASEKLVCENMSTTLTVSGAGSIDWFDDVTSTAAIASGSVYVTDPLPPGVYTYYAQATNFSLTSPQTAVTFTVTECTSLGNTVGDKDVKIYPNPAAGVFSVELSHEINFLKVYSLDGRLITSQETKNGVNTVDLTQHPDGMYFIKLMNNDAVVSIKKVLVQGNKR